MTMPNTWEKAREQGRKEGHQEGALNVLLRQLRARFGELPAATVARVEAADPAALKRWSERVLTAQIIADVLDELS